MRRKAVIKHKRVDRTERVEIRALAGIRHLHFCLDRECRLIYEDTCNTPEHNQLCDVCRGRQRSVYMPVRDPQECCLDNCEQVTRKSALLTHQLAGPGPWFQCKTCARCHGWPCTTT